MQRLMMFSIALALASALPVTGEDFARWVDPLVGTVGEGNTIPGAAYPFGMVQPGPDSGKGVWCPGYKNDDRTIRGISQTHLNGTGCPAMGDISLMPYTGTTDGIDYSSEYSEQSCAPDRYSVRFGRFGVKAEATCSEHVSWLSFSYEKPGDAKVFVDCASTLLQKWRQKSGPVIPASGFALSASRDEISGWREVRGWTTYRLHYVIKFDHPWSACVRQPGNAFEGEGDRFDVSFSLKDGERLGARVALSTVDVDGARKNLEAESAGKDFDQVARDSRAAWNELLGRCQLTKGTDEQKRNWYTALYRLFIQPNNIADVDGRYRGADGKVAKADCGRYYSTLSLWDTFRAAHPLYTLLAPERVDGFVETMLRHHAAHGHLPVWTLWGAESHDMIGVHSIPVIVDAWAKGFRRQDGRRLLKAMVRSMTANDGEWDELAWNITWENGYIPYRPGVFDKFHVRHGNVSRTLEHAYDWWCIARMAEMLGDERCRREAAKWSETWKNVFDKSVGFARPRAPKSSGGAFLEPFDPRAERAEGEFWSDFTEANSWIYTWHVFQDPQGLAEAMGGRDSLLAKLDEFFSTAPKGGRLRSGQIGQYWHGNEPSHHIAYFYSLFGERAKTARLVETICRDFYRPAPDGLCGNDDCGQMSAWYLFSMMGFYPFNPCGGDYVLGAAQAEEVKLNFKNGSVFTIRRGGKGNVTLNGRPVGRAWISHADVVSGGTLSF